MKHIYILVAILTLGVSISNAQCINGNLESCNFTNWVGATGTNQNGTVNLNNITVGWSNTGVNPRHSIVPTGNDPIVPALSMVSEGNCAMRLGNSGSGSQADLAKYTFTVTNANKDFSFRYAMVMEDGSHTAQQQAFFSYLLFVGTNWTDWANPISNLITSKKFVADKTNPYFNVQGSVVWKNWTSECIDLSAHLGKQVTIMFVTADCSQSGHYGYAYIDGLCQNNQAIANLTLPTEVCQGAPLIADASASINEQSHFWSVQESDINWNRYGPEYTQWYVAQQAGTMDINQFVQNHGGQLKCNTYYRVKIAVSSECTPWNETTKLVYIRCPIVNAGPDKCCTSGIGEVNPGNYIYSWSPTTGLNSPNSPYTTINCNALVGNGPWEYTLTATDKKGCKNTDKVLVYRDVPKVTITQEGGCCSRNLTAVVKDPYTSIVWSTGATTPSITVSSDGIYSVTVSNPCGSSTSSINVQNSLSRYYANLNDPNIQSYYSSKTNQTSSGNFEIYNVETLLPPYGEYHATEYKLELWNRWGQLFHTITGTIESCQGFANPAIKWDGKINGQQVQEDVYNGTLFLKNCAHPNWTQVKVDYCETYGWNCTQTECQFFLFSFNCGFFKKNVCVSGYPYCAVQKKEYVFPVVITW